MKNLYYKLLVMYFLAIASSWGQNQSEVRKPFIKNIESNINISEANIFLVNLFSLNNDYSFERTGQPPFADQYGMVHYKYQQLYKGLRIEHAIVILHTKNELITSLNGTYINHLILEINPLVSNEDALTFALNEINAKKYIWEDENAEIENFEKPQGQLVIFTDYITKVQTLTYKFKIVSLNPFDQTLIYIDAQTGELEHRNSMINFCIKTADFCSESNIDAPLQSLPNILVDGIAYTNYNGAQEIGTQANAGGFILRNPRVETLKSLPASSYCDFSEIGTDDLFDNDNFWFQNELKEDSFALDAHWAAQQVYEYFYDIHDRNSYDNLGNIIQSYIHACPDFFGNIPFKAGWMESVFGVYGGIAYGDDNATAYNQPVTTLDIAAHEFGHGVSNNTVDGGFSTQGESPALNESFSDIWAACVEHNYFGNNPNPNPNDTDKDKWTLGEELDINLPGINFIRSFKNPKDPSSYLQQPDTYEGQYWDYQNDGHINSGVQNHWFYLLSEGGSGTNDNQLNYNVTGIGIENAAEIVYSMLTSYLSSNSTYADSRIASEVAAGLIFQNNPSILASVQNAWCAIGVGECAPCSFDLTITQDVLDGQTDIQEAENVITASNIIFDGAVAAYDAGASVILNDGFHAKPGSDFHAFIEGCFGDKPKTKSFSAQETVAHQSLENNEELNSLKIFPNPTNKLLTVESNYEMASWELTSHYRHFSLNGNIENKTPRIFQLDIEHLPTGIYYLRVNLKNGEIIMRKVLKE